MVFRNSQHKIRRNVLQISAIVVDKFRRCGNAGNERNYGQVCAISFGGYQKDHQERAGHLPRAPQLSRVQRSVHSESLSDLA